MSSPRKPRAVAPPLFMTRDPSPHSLPQIIQPTAASPLLSAGSFPSAPRSTHHKPRSHISGAIGGGGVGGGVPPSPSTSTSTTAPPMLRESSVSSQMLGSRYQDTSPASPAATTTTTAASVSQNPKSQTTSQEREGSEDTHERLWKSMQQKLSEVTLTTDHVFGPSHTTSLNTLRASQISLAQAWMRSERDDDALDTQHAEFRVVGKGGGGNGGGAEDDEETEADVLLARKRRAANDWHFGRIAMGVKDVTGKLEEVAKAMRGVEMESRGIWGSEEGSFEEGVSTGESEVR